MSKIIHHWSSGKDSALSLYYLQKKYTIKRLITTLNLKTYRVSMHGIPKELLMAQQKSIGIAIQNVYLDSDASLETYNKQMQYVYQDLFEEGFNTVSFGDILLEDLKLYREAQLDKIGMSYSFPLWGKNTLEVMKEFIHLGFKAVVVAVQTDKLSKEWVGRVIDDSFLEDLPAGVDASGENGEYHTFVFDGPNFSFPIKYQIEKVVTHNYFANSDVDDNCFKDIEEQSWATNFHFADIQVR